MYQWTVTIPTIPTIRTDGAEQTRGTQTWIVYACLPHEAREVALAAATTEAAVRHRRGAVLDTTAVDVARWQRDDFL